MADLLARLLIRISSGGCWTVENKNDNLHLSILVIIEHEQAVDDVFERLTEIGHPAEQPENCCI